MKFPAARRCPAFSGRVVRVALAALLLGGWSALPAQAAGQPSVTSLCTVSDKRVDELSGLVSDGQHWYAINDGGNRIEVWVLGRDCAVQRVIRNQTDPYDVEDLARSANGTLWLSDTGDNSKKRPTIALHEVRPDGRSTLHRLSYPDGQHDTEALLLDRSGVPYLITKNVLGNAGIYRPSGPLASPGPTKLENVGSVRIASTDTPGGPVGSIGSVLVTGAASSADGRVIALRTYTDAYLYPAPDGDVLAALGRQPVRIPLPGEKQGEAIAFEPDGTLLSGSEGVGEPIRSVAGAAGLVPLDTGTDEGTSDTSSGAGDGADGADSGVPVLPALGIAAVVALVAVFGIGALRRRRR